MKDRVSIDIFERARMGLDATCSAWLHLPNLYYPPAPDGGRGQSGTRKRWFGKRGIKE